jgi:AbrB family looped-hinge helix DNA binding protein
MKRPQSRLTVQGQISVPAEVRKRLGLAPGAVLEWKEEEGQYVVRRVGRHSSEDIHRALFPKPPRAASLSELTDGVKRHVRRKHARD